MPWPFTVLLLITIMNLEHIQVFRFEFASFQAEVGFDADGKANNGLRQSFRDRMPTAVSRRCCGAK